MNRTITVGERKFCVKHSKTDGKWKAVVIMQPPTSNQLYTLPAPWSCEADTEEELNQMLSQHFDKMR